MHAMNNRLFGAIVLVLPAALGAQTSTSGASVAKPVAGNTANATGAPVDIADSAALARAEFRLARESLTKGDTAGALAKLEAAARAFPQQPSYMNSLMALAGRARASNFAATALAMSNNIGFAVPASADTGAHSVRKLPDVLKLVSLQDALRAPVNNSQVFRTLTDSTLFPEGVSYDARTGTMYVSSLHHRNIVALPRAGGSQFLMKEVPPNVGGLYGIAVDTARSVVWATSASAPGTSALAVGDTALPALLEIRLSDGKLLRRFEMRTSAPVTSPGDITLSPNGDVLVSDAQAGVLWRLPRGDDSLVAIRNKLFRSLQGIAPSRDGKVVWIADYSHGILRVELPSGITTRVADLPGHSVLGIDGLVAYGNTLVGVQNLYNPAQVVQLTLNTEGTRIVKHTVLDRNVLAASPTGGVVLDHALIYVANSLWDSLDNSGNVSSTATLPRPVLLRLPLNAGGRASPRGGSARQRQP